MYIKKNVATVATNDRESKIVKSRKYNFVFLQFERDGILVIENFLDQEEVKALRNACDTLVENMDPEVHRGVFSAEAKDTQAHVRIA